jgi:hypothetical protein
MLRRRRSSTVLRRAMPKDASQLQQSHDGAALKQTLAPGCAVSCVAFGGARLACGCHDGKIIIYETVQREICQSAFPLNTTINRRAATCSTRCRRTAAECGRWPFRRVRRIVSDFASIQL